MPVSMILLDSRVGLHFGTSSESFFLFFNRRKDLAMAPMGHPVGAGDDEPHPPMEMMSLFKHMGIG